MNYRVVYESGYTSWGRCKGRGYCEIPLRYHFDICGVSTKKDARKKAKKILKQERHGAVYLNENVKITHVIPAHDYVRIWWNEFADHGDKYRAVMSILPDVHKGDKHVGGYNGRYLRDQEYAKDANMICDRCEKWGDLPMDYRKELKKISYLVVGNRGWREIK